MKPYHQMTDGELSHADLMSRRRRAAASDAELVRQFGGTDPHRDPVYVAINTEWSRRRDR